MSIPKSKTIEENLAKKLTALRSANGWTYEQLAARMLEHGIPTHPSAIQKSEKSGRKVTLSELVAYSRIYGTPLAQLLDVDATVLDKQAWVDAAEVERLATELVEHLRRIKERT